MFKILLHTTKKNTFEDLEDCVDEKFELHS